MRFVGEVHCPTFHGYIHGALLPGIETVAAYLYEAGLGPNPKENSMHSICYDVSTLACKVNAIESEKEEL